MIHESEETRAGTAATGDRVGDFELSPLGKRLMEIRKNFIAHGGKLLTRVELEREIAERRGGAHTREYEEDNVR
ncbi:MAG: hypothetical protein FJ118_10605 [Deltaproteobacteria bacterium]|nr:hypothetical protein [Deltaproteobacteria bacterium]